MRRKSARREGAATGDGSVDVRQTGDFPRSRHFGGIEKLTLDEMWD